MRAIRQWISRRFCRQHDAALVIRPPRVIYRHYDWSQTHKLVPTGAAALAKVVAARYDSAAPQRQEPPTP